MTCSILYPLNTLWTTATLKTSPYQLILPDNSSRKISHAFFRQDSTSLGWFYDSSSTTIYPAIHLRNTSKDHPEYLLNLEASLPVRSSKHRLEQSLLQSLGKLIPHDLNGKIMGINGILASWQQIFPEEKIALEDLDLIRESFASLSAETTLLSWLFKESHEFQRVFKLSEINQNMESYLKRFFSPPNSLTLKISEPDNSVFSTPHEIAFWVAATSKAIALTQTAKEPVEIALSSQHEETKNESTLTLHINCSTFAYLIRHLNLEDIGKLPHLLIDWIILFFHRGGTWESDPNDDSAITLHLPITTHHPERLTTSFITSESDISPDSKEQGTYHIKDPNDVSWILRTILPHIHTLKKVTIHPSATPENQAIINQALDSLNRDYSLQLQTIP